MREEANHWPFTVSKNMVPMDRIVSSQTENREMNPEGKLDELKSKITELQQQINAAESVVKTKEEEKAPLKTLYSWEAPNRVHADRSNLWYAIVSLGFMLTIAFAALSKDIMLVLVIVVLMFLVYLSNVIKPQIVTHEITNKGIKSGSNIWLWHNIDGFWLSKRGKQMLLILDLNVKNSPSRVILLVGTGDYQQILKLLLKHIPYFSRKEVQEDLINIFTIGEYIPLTQFIDAKKSA